MLDLAQADPALPQALWRARLALAAAEQSLRQAGRPENLSALRDLLCLLRPGEAPGPAGAVALAWHHATRRKLSGEGLQRALPALTQAQLNLWAESGGGNPVAQAAGIIEAILTDAPRAQLPALILADATLARRLGWGHMIPLLGGALPPRALRLRGQDLRLACHRALVTSARAALSQAADLTRRAARLQAVLPKLRARQAGQAVEMFLTRDAIAPAALIALMSDRAARRFCDRLVTLGVAREMTGRETFRLYGL